MPNPITGQRFPYFDVEILEKGNDFVRFRMKDGQVLEQHGSFIAAMHVSNPDCSSLAIQG